MANLSPRLRLLLSGAVLSLLALFLGAQIAQESYGLAVILAAAVLVAGFQVLKSPSLGTLLLGLSLVGYIVGNRGFAQISLAGVLPLFMAEFTLFVTGCILLVQCARSHSTPIRKESLNLVILVWMLVCSFRLPLDMHTFGIIALRDYATVYYASFFFLAQAEGSDTDARGLLFNCLKYGTGALLLIYPLHQQFTGFFMDTLTLRGVPVIYYKDDLAGTFMAVGAVLFFLQFEKEKKWWAFLISMALIGLVLSTSNRASLLGLAVATLILLVAGRWRFALWQSLLAVIASLGILVAAHVTNRTWKETPLYDTYERIASLVDPLGKGEYTGESSANKGDNNAFRTVWWRICIEETIAQNPVLGLGYGYDLAEDFTRIYFPQGGEDASPRSPHCVLITLFARTGILGLLPFVALAILIFKRSIAVARKQDEQAIGLWCTCSIILTSSIFGVVLEGPMGAVVFWTCLGLAQASSTVEESSEKPALPAQP